MGMGLGMASAIFIDLRMAHMIIAAAFLLIAFFIPDFAGSVVFKQDVPLEVQVTKNSSATSEILGTFSNPVISYPLVKEQVSTDALVLISTAVPIPLILISTLISFFCVPCKTPKIQHGDEPDRGESEVSSDYPPCTKSPAFYFGIRFMDGISGLLESVAITLFVTETLKLAVGQPRPDYKEMHIEDPLDSISSFPSGHSSVAFASFTYASLVMWHSLGAPLMKMPNMHVLILPLVLVCTAPLCISTWIAVTRVQDYHHRTVDILAGSIIGMTSSVMIFSIHKLVPQRTLTDKSAE